MLLYEYCDERESLSMEKVLRMTLLHDLVEIYAGDTYAYDVGEISQNCKERKTQRKNCFLHCLMIKNASFTRCGRNLKRVSRLRQDLQEWRIPLCLFITIT